MKKSFLTTSMVLALMGAASVSMVGCATDDDIKVLEEENAGVNTELKKLQDALDAQKNGLTEDLATKEAELKKLIESNASQAEVDKLQEAINALNASVAALEELRESIGDISALEARIAALEGKEHLTAEAVQAMIDATVGKGLTDEQKTAVNKLIEEQLTQENLSGIVKAIITAELGDVSSQLGALKDKVDGLADTQDQVNGIIAGYANAAEFNAAFKEMVENYTWIMSKVSTIKYPSVNNNTVNVILGKIAEEDVTFNGVTYEAGSRIKSGKVSVPVLVNPGNVTFASLSDPRLANWTLMTPSETLPGLEINCRLWNEFDGINPQSRLMANQMVTLDVALNEINLDTPIENIAVKLEQKESAEAVEYGNSVMTTYDLKISQGPAKDVTVIANAPVVLYLGDQMRADHVTYNVDEENVADWYVDLPLESDRRLVGDNLDQDALDNGYIHFDQSTTNDLLYLDEKQITFEYHGLDYNFNTPTARFKVLLLSPLHDGGMVLEDATYNVSTPQQYSQHILTVFEEAVKNGGMTIAQEEQWKRLSREGKIEAGVVVYKTNEDGTRGEAAIGLNPRIVAGEVLVDFPKAYEHGTYEVVLSLTDKRGVSDGYTVAPIEVVGKVKINAIVAGFTPVPEFWVGKLLNVVNVPTPASADVNSILQVNMHDVLKFEPGVSGVDVAWTYAAIDAEGAPVAYPGLDVSTHEHKWSPSAEGSFETNYAMIGKEIKMRATVTMTETPPAPPVRALANTETYEYTVKFVNPIADLTINKPLYELTADNTAEQQEFIYLNDLAISDKEDRALVKDAKYIVGATANDFTVAKVYGVNYAEAKFKTQLIITKVEGHDNFSFDADTKQIFWNKPGAALNQPVTAKFKVTLRHQFGETSTFVNVKVNPKTTPAN